MFLDGLVGEFWRRQEAHRLEGQVAKVRLAVAQELAELVASPDQQIRFAKIEENEFILSSFFVISHFLVIKFY